MKILDFFSVRAKLQIITGLAIAGLLSIGLLAIRDIKELSNANDATFKQLVAIKAQCMADMYHDNLRGLFYKALLLEKAPQSEKDDVLQESRESQQSFREHIETVRANIEDPESKTAVEQIRKPLDDYLATMSIYIPMALENHAKAFSEQSQVETRFEELEKPMQQVAGLIQNLSESTREQSRKTAEKVEIVVYSLGGSVLLIFLVLSMLLGKSIVRSIEDISKASRKVSEGDLSTRVHIESNDELGTLARDFNGMVESVATARQEADTERQRVEELARKSDELNLEAQERTRYLDDSVETMVAAMKQFAQGDLTVSLSVTGKDSIALLFDQFNQTTDAIRMVVSNVRAAVDATASASSEISSSTEEMAAGTSEQTSQTHEVASAIEEMTKTISENSLHAKETSEAAEAARAHAEAGGKVISDAVEGMKRIARVVRNSADTIKTLGDSSTQIGEIISVINSIADQTNLLALNAAIEAARAGEQGRGFAVVADEVRKLAERTTTATKEISDTIQKIQHDTVGAVNSISEGTREVENGIKLTDRAGESLESILKAINEVSIMIRQIAVASHEQSNASEQISRSVEAISTVTSETATGTQQIARAADDLNQLTENLYQLVANFQIEPKAAQGSHSHAKAGMYADKPLATVQRRVTDPMYAG